MKLISIQGPQAVGKSTLAKSLPGYLSYSALATREFGEHEKQIQRERKYDLEKRFDFIKNEIVFFRGEYARWMKIKELKHDVVILDRGPEDTYCFTYIHPRAIAADWNIDNLIPKLKSKYILRESDMIIYLHADKDVLVRRKNNDTSRQRLIFDKLLQYYELEKEFFGNLRTTRFINASNSSSVEIAEKCAQLITGLIEVKNEFLG